jgi:hypothetical protein
MLDGLSTHDCDRLVRSMAEAVAGVHGVAPHRLAAARSDCAALDERWLRDAVEVMTNDIRAGYREWRHVAKR